MISACRKKITSPEDPADTTDWAPLLNDDELMTETDPNAAVVTQEWADWIIENHEPIRSLEHEDFRDLQFLKDLIGDRRIVQLGESSHGVKEFNKMKVRLVKFLHQEMGFNVLAFECGVFECNHANYFTRHYSSRNLLRNTIFPVWHAEEVVPLFDYIKTDHDSYPQLNLAGFDVQICTDYSETRRPRFYHDVIAHIDSALAVNLFQLDSDFHTNTNNYTLVREYITANYDSLVNRYQEVADLLDQHMTALMQIYESEPYVPLITRQSIVSTIWYIEMMYLQATSQDIYSGSARRDRGMAENVDFLLDVLYPNEKIIIWAHNGHIRHNNHQVTYCPWEIRTMGHWISTQHRALLYTIGLYMYRGQAAYNTRTIYDLTPTADNSLEAIMYQTRRKFSFIDMLHQAHNSGNSWMRERIIAKYRGEQNWEMILKDQYDGILFIDTVHPPDYLSY